MVAPLEVGLCVSDLDRARAFYEGLLGFSFVSSIPTPPEQAIGSGICHSGYTVVRLQLPTGERIKLFAPDSPPKRIDRGKQPLSQVGYAFITLIVADLNALLIKLATKGITPRSPGAYGLRPNVVIALIGDPDGNVVELVQFQNLRAYRADVRDCANDLAG
jgi:catechol 2,3-dioxygenase-like lactoylglutathione lyase family enzyme